MPITLVVLFGFLVVAGGVGFGVWYFTHSVIKTGEKGQAALLKDAAPGEAKIIEVGASEGNRGSTEVALRLEVTPQFGESYNAFTVWAVEPAHMADIQAGKTVAVKVAESPAGKSKTEKIKSIFPDVKWAELWYEGMEFTEESMKTLTYK